MDFSTSTYRTASIPCSFCTLMRAHLHARAACGQTSLATQKNWMSFFWYPFSLSLIFSHSRLLLCSNTCSHTCHHIASDPLTAVIYVEWRCAVFSIYVLCLNPQISTSIHLPSLTHPAFPDLFNVSVLYLSLHNCHHSPPRSPVAAVLFRGHCGHLWTHSCDVDVPVRVSIGSFEGSRTKQASAAVMQDPALRLSGLYAPARSQDLYVTAQLFAAGQPLMLPMQTSYTPGSRPWNEWLTLPIKYRDLPRTARLVLTVWDIGVTRGRRDVVGGTCIDLFASNGTVQEGRFTLKVWEGLEGDGVKSTTIGIQNTEIARLEMLSRRREEGTPCALLPFP